MKLSDYKYLIAENAATLSANLHQSSRFPQLYEQIGEVVGGFPAIWNMAAEWGMQLAFLEKRRTIDPDKVEWIEFVERLVEDLIDKCLELDGLPQDKEVNDIIMACYNKMKENR